MQQRDSFRRRIPGTLSRGRAFTGLELCLVLAPCLLLRAASAPAVAPTLATNGTPVFVAAKLQAIDAAMTNAIANGDLPGGVVWLEHRGQIYQRAYGARALEPEREAMTLDTLFDAASLTKVVATTPAILLLIERGALTLEDPVPRHLPEFRAPGTDGITVRHLLTHTSGLRAGLSRREEWSGYDKAIALACQEKPETTPGTAFRYSDINFILLGEIVRRRAGQTLDRFVQAEIYRPLGMVDTGFLPPDNKRPRIAPTEKDGEGWLRGQVHDPTARRMGGVAGHAGLFTTARDLARYARMVLEGGSLEGKRILRPESVRLMTSIQSPEPVPAKRGLGWDIDSDYSSVRGERFPKGSFGHTGWTGTSLWIDPASRTFVILLSHRNHPNGNGTVVQLRKQLGTLAAEALPGNLFPPAASTNGGRTNAVLVLPPQPPVTAKVLNGIDVLKRDQFAPLRKRRIGLITNHTGVDRHRTPTIDLLHQAPDVQLKALFSPEHGLRGTQDEQVRDSVDGPTGLPVHSLYGERKAPTPEQLQELDTLVFDIQDIGCRFYTYISTLSLCLEAAAQAKRKFIVLDRVNPINGVTIEGPVHRGPPSFIAPHALPLRHGMTAGELARLFQAEKGLPVDLTVIALEGWRREMWFDDTGLPWVNPSPNMRNLKEAILYPGVGLLERALTVGRGTDTPFEVLGAPYVDDLFLADRLNAQQIPGVRFVPVRFTPSASTFSGQSCGGVYLQLTDRDRCPVVDIGVAAALILQQQFPAHFALDQFQALSLDAGLTDAVRRSQSLAAIKASWATDLESFKQRRQPYLLYP